MLKNYVTFAWRNIWKYRLHLIINILGLAIGLGASLAILALIEYELGFNKGFEKYERIQRVYTHFTGKFEGTNRGVSCPLRKLVKDEISGIAAQANISTFNARITIPEGDNRREISSQGDIAFINDDFFEVFSGYTWLAGDKSALLKPYQLVLTKQKADLYFGPGAYQRLLGRELLYQDSLRVQLAGIVEVPKFRNDLYFGDYISESTLEASFLKDEFSLNEWGNINSSTNLFIRLAEQTSPERVGQTINQIARTRRDTSDWDYEADYKLQPLEDMHFNTQLGIFDNSRRPAHLPSLWILAGIAGLILLLASINYINYATAISLHRSREVGVRKVMGSGVYSLILQFLSETFIVSLLAGILGYVFAEKGISYLEDLLRADTGQILRRPLVFLLLMAVVVLGTLLAGLYPALILSRFQPVNALKNQIQVGKNTGSVALVRRGLLTFQFMAAQVLVVLALIVVQQHRYMLNQDMGFRKASVVSLNFSFQSEYSLRLRVQARLGALPFVKNTSLHNSTPASNSIARSTISYRDDSVDFDEQVHSQSGDTSYIHLFNIPLLAGRNVRANNTIHELLINETLMRKIGCKSPPDAIGKELELGTTKYKVVGVIRDFHPISLKHELPPLVYRYSNFSYTLSMVIDQASDKLPVLMQQLEDAWQEVLPEQPFNPSFLDETISYMYLNERIVSIILTLASSVIILIACMGLFGLSMLLVAQKTKEISIRKVLGASVLQILQLLTGGFARLVGAAFLLALPVGWLLGRRFLDDFAYRINLDWWLFAFSGIATLILALLTVSVLGVRAARSNPVDYLKNE